MKNPGKKKNTWLTAILLVIMAVGAGLLIYPTFSDWWNSFHQSRAIARYVESVSSMDTEAHDRLFAEAEAYNRTLIRKDGRFLLSDKEKEEYKGILYVTGTGIMGYVEIPSIGISLPIYHGTDEAVLQTAIGHIEGTSFPVGGAGTHAVVSGHRGLPSAKLFSDLDKLNTGDRFMLQVLDRTLTYEVDQIRIVLPSELQDLMIDPDQDYCTLLTCTPYGINTHRLLVRGHRVENEAGVIDVKPDALQIEPVMVAPLVAAPILLLLLIFVLAATGGTARKRRTRREKEKQRLLEALRNGNEGSAE